MAFAKSEAATPAMDPAAPVPATPGLLGAIGIVAGLAAIAASSCCVLPLTLAALGAGAGVFGALEALVFWRIPLLVTSGAWVAVAWFIWWRNRRATCGAGADCATQPRNWAPLSLLLLAALIVVLAIGWNYLEFPLLRLMRTT
jgi:mercuric ion transport protein